MVAPIVKIDLLKKMDADRKILEQKLKAIQDKDSIEYLNAETAIRAHDVEAGRLLGFGGKGINE